MLKIWTIKAMRNLFQKISKFVIYRTKTLFKTCDPENVKIFKTFSTQFIVIPMWILAEESRAN